MHQTHSHHYKATCDNSLESRKAPLNVVEASRESPV